MLAKWMQFGRRPSRFRGLRSRRVMVLESLEMRALMSADGVSAIVSSAEAESSTVISDFSLIDVNANSPTHAQSVSPRDYLNQVSAYYFGYGL
jgi:hypothetical protein